MYGVILIGLLAALSLAGPALPLLITLISLGAVGDSVTNKNLPDAVVFNEMWDANAVSIWARADPAVVMAFGTPIKDGAGNVLLDSSGLPTFSRTTNIKGRKIEAMSETDVDDGVGIDTEWSNTRSGQVEPDDYFNQEWDWARIRFELDFSGRTLTQYSKAGKNGKVDWIGIQSKRMANQQARTLAKHLHLNTSGGAPAKKQVGSLWYAIDDGVTNATYSNYGSLLRGNAGNTDYQPAYQNSTVGNLERYMLGKGQGEALVRGGHLKVGISGVDVNLVIQDILQGFAEAEVKDEFLDFGWTGYRYAGQRFVVSGYAPSNRLVSIDPDSFHSWLDDAPAVAGANMDGTGNSIVRDPLVLDGYMMEHFINVQCLCRQVNHNVKYEGINTR